MRRKFKANDIVRIGIHGAELEGFDENKIPYELIEKESWDIFIIQAKAKYFSDEALENDAELVS